MISVSKYIVLSPLRTRFVPFIVHLKGLQSEVLEGAVKSCGEWKRAVESVRDLQRNLRRALIATH